MKNDQPDETFHPSNLQTFPSSSRVFPGIKGANNAEIGKAHRALKRLAAWRVDDYEQWIRVGMCLRELGEAGFDLWDGWSRQSAKYPSDPREMCYKWKSFTPAGEKGLTLASLHAMAREDDPRPARKRPSGAAEDAREPAVPAVAAPSAEEDPALWEYNLTDTGNAERFARLYRAYARYCPAWGKWLIWDNRRFKPDTTLQIDQLAKVVNWTTHVEAACSDDRTKREQTTRWALQSESKQRRQAMIDLARSEHGIAVEPSDLDKDPWKLNVLNGTLDLKTGRLEPHRQGDLITKLAPVDYRPDLPCPTFLAFLDRVLGGNPSLITYVRKLLGYTLTGVTRERILLILHGSGRNGKSTLLEVVRAILGDYALRTPTQTLIRKRGDAIPNDIARLQGARFVSASETEDTQSFAESLIKEMTGQDTISARFLHAEWFEFRPQFKLWLATNHKPVIRGTDQAIWDRVRLIPFDVRIPDEEQDPELLDKLLREAPGILAWIAKGCLLWQQEGLDAPPAVSAATEGYRQEMDLLADFIEDCCETGPRSTASACDLYEAYTAWCEQNGAAPCHANAFGKRLAERGFVRVKGTAGRRQWQGLDLVAPVASSGSRNPLPSRGGAMDRKTVNTGHLRPLKPLVAGDDEDPLEVVTL